MKVLYVGRSNSDPEDFCPGSMVCMSLVERFREQIQVQDCSILRQSQELPPWLNGTPIFVDQTQGIPHRGSEAVRELQRLLRSETPTSQSRRPSDPDDDDDNQPSSPRRAPPRGSVQQGPPRMAPPAQTRQPSQQPGIPVKQPSTPVSCLGPESMGAAKDDEVDDDGFDATDNGSTSNAPIGSEKLTENDLQKFMELRNSSPASAAPPQTPAQI